MPSKRRLGCPNVPPLRSRVEPQAALQNRQMSCVVNVTRSLQAQQASGLTDSQKCVALMEASRDDLRRQLHCAQAALQAFQWALCVHAVPSHCLMCHTCNQMEAKHSALAHKELRWQKTERVRTPEQLLELTGQSCRRHAFMVHGVSVEAIHGIPCLTSASDGAFKLWIEQWFNESCAEDILERQLQSKSYHCQFAMILTWCQALFVGACIIRIGFWAVPYCESSPAFPAEHCHLHHHHCHHHPHQHHPPRQCHHRHFRMPSCCTIRNSHH